VTSSGSTSLSKRRFALLVNPAAAGGRARDALPLVRAELDRLGATYREVETKSIEHARSEAGKAADEGDTVATLGGDGLVGPVAGVLRGREVALAVLPGGRGNDFARMLSIPSDPAAAARVAVEGEERRVDVADVNGNPYVGIASFGFDSDANRIANQAKVVRGNLVYLYAGLRALAAWKPAEFTVTVDGSRHEFTGYSVSVGNSRYYGGGMLALPEAEIDDGRLDVLTVAQHGKLRALGGMAKVFKGDHIDPRWMNVVRGEVVEVASDRPFVIYADGDPIGATPATMRVHPHSLRVVVPA
jgi:YegS/Rv2252/BmrU family lipid kinase